MWAWGGGQQDPLLGTAVDVGVLSYRGKPWGYTSKSLLCYKCHREVFLEISGAGPTCNAPFCRFYKYIQISKA